MRKRCLPFIVGCAAVAFSQAMTMAATVHSISGNFLDATPNPVVMAHTFTLLGDKPVTSQDPSAVLAGFTTDPLDIDLSGPGWTGGPPGDSGPVLGSLQLGNLTISNHLGSEAVFSFDPNANYNETLVFIPGLGYLGISVVTAHATLVSATGPAFPVGFWDSFAGGATLALQFSGVLVTTDGPNSGQALIENFSVSGNYVLVAIPEPATALLATSGALVVAACVGLSRRRSQAHLS